MEDFHGGGSTETVIIALCGLPAEIIQAKKEKQTVCQLFQSFFINSGGDRHLHGEETLPLRGFFFSNFFIETVFTVGVEILENGEESLQMCFIMILVPRQDLEKWVFYSRGDFYFEGGRISFDSGGSVFKEFLILRIFFVFVTEFGRNGKWLVEKFFFLSLLRARKLGMLFIIRGESS